MHEEQWSETPKEKYLLGDIKTDPKRIECGGMNWIQLAQNRIQKRNLVNMVKNLSSRKGGTFIDHFKLVYMTCDLTFRKKWLFL